MFVRSVFDLSEFVWSVSDWSVFDWLIGGLTPACRLQRRKLTTTQVAQRANIDRTTLYYIERGRPSVSIGNYFNVLRALNLHEDFLKLAADDELGRKLQDMDL